MTPEWWALSGLLALIVSQDSRQDYERDGRHLYRWALTSVLGMALFIVGAVQVAVR